MTLVRVILSVRIILFPAEFSLQRSLPAENFINIAETFYFRNSIRTFEVEI